MKNPLERLREFDFVMIEGGPCGWLCWLRYASGHIELFGKGRTLEEMIYAVGVSLEQRAQQKGVADAVKDAVVILKESTDGR